MNGEFMLGFILGQIFQSVVVFTCYYLTFKRNERNQK